MHKGLLGNIAGANQMSSDSITQSATTPSSQLEQPDSAARENSPVVYGLGVIRQYIV